MRRVALFRGCFERSELGVTNCDHMPKLHPTQGVGNDGRWITPTAARRMSGRGRQSGSIALWCMDGPDVLVQVGKGVCNHRSPWATTDSRQCSILSNDDYTRCNTYAVAVVAAGSAAGPRAGHVAIDHRAGPELVAGSIFQQCCRHEAISAAGCAGRSRKTNTSFSTKTGTVSAWYGPGARPAACSPTALSLSSTDTGNGIARSLPFQ